MLCIIVLTENIKNIVIILYNTKDDFFYLTIKHLKDLSTQNHYN